MWPTVVDTSLDISIFILLLSALSAYMKGETYFTLCGSTVDLSQVESTLMFLFLKGESSDTFDICLCWPLVCVTLYLLQDRPHFLRSLFVTLYHYLQRLYMSYLWLLHRLGILSLFYVGGNLYLFTITYSFSGSSS